MNWQSLHYRKRNSIRFTEKEYANISKFIFYKIVVWKRDIETLLGSEKTCSNRNFTAINSNEFESFFQNNWKMEHIEGNFHLVQSQRETHYRETSEPKIKRRCDISERLSLIWTNSNEIRIFFTFLTNRILREKSGSWGVFRRSHNVILPKYFATSQDLYFFDWSDHVYYRESLTCGDIQKLTRRVGNGSKWKITKILEFNVYKCCRMIETTGKEKDVRIEECLLPSSITEIHTFFQLHNDFFNFFSTPYSILQIFFFALTFFFSFHNPT